MLIPFYHFFFFFQRTYFWRGGEREGKGTREAPTDVHNTMSPESGCRLPNSRSYALPARPETKTLDWGSETEAYVTESVHGNPAGLGPALKGGEEDGEGEGRRKAERERTNKASSQLLCQRAYSAMDPTTASHTDAD